jgi:hypothetical protein
MKLAPQAHAAIMMCLQKCIMEEIDIRPLLDGLDFVIDDDQPEFLIVTNPPSFKVSGEVQEAVEDKVVMKDSTFKWEE